MPKKPMAVDIVLIPDAHLFEQALAINADLVKRHHSAIVLHPIHCLPHISLAMGGIDEDDIHTIGQRLHAIWRECRLTELLHTRGLVYATDPQGKTVSSIELVKDNGLQIVHERVMESVSPYFKYHVTEDMFVGQGPISESSLTWVEAFKDNSAYEDFWPHITLGYGKAKAVKIRDIFYADSLKLCQLGNHCTCQKVLMSV
ncbi:MAG: hypothetical protein K9N55_02800 [Phycisphaerae bacterium]|nr:hypothetical protein [Phycisphaerae bacterium]